MMRYVDVIPYSEILFNKNLDYSIGLVMYILSSKFMVEHVLIIPF